METQKHQVQARDGGHMPVIPALESTEAGGLPQVRGQPELYETLS